jgi:tol-pal system protein YbgF
MRGWIIFSVGLLLFGCVGIKHVQILDKDLDRLQSRINILQKENNSSKKEISDLRAKNKELKTDLSLWLENLQSEIRTLSTNVEEYKEFLNRPSEEMDRFWGKMEGRLITLEEKRKTQEDKIKEIEDRLGGLDGKTAKWALKPMESERSDSTKEVLSELKGVSTGMGDLYRDAYESFHKGNLEGARRKFEAFLKQYPNTELSNNAQFWIGETYYQKKDFEKAILEYEKAITQYPEGGKIPVVLFKEGLAFLELGDKGNARRLLTGVIERYPYSDQAEIAKKKLEAIK